MRTFVVAVLVALVLVVCVTAIPLEERGRGGRKGNGRPKEAKEPGGGRKGGQSRYGSYENQSGGRKGGKGKAKSGKGGSSEEYDVGADFDILHVMQGMMTEQDHEFLFTNYCPDYIDNIEQLIQELQAIEAVAQQQNVKRDHQQTAMRFQELMLDLFYQLFNSLSPELQQMVATDYCTQVEQIAGLFNVSTITTLRVIIDTMDMDMKDEVVGRYCTDAQAFLEELIRKYGINRRKRDVATDPITDEDKARTMFAVMIFLEDSQHFDIINTFCSQPAGETPATDDEQVPQTGGIKRQMSKVDLARALLRALGNMKR